MHNGIFNPYTVKGGEKFWPMTYYFAYNFWTVRDTENSFGDFSQIWFVYKTILKSTKNNDVMTS